MIKGHTFDEQLFESSMFRLFLNTYSNKMNGVIKQWKQGCSMSNTVNTITVNDGVCLMQGGIIEIDGGETVTIDTDNAYCKLALEVDLNQINTEEQLSQVKLKILKGVNSYPTLRQDDIVSTGTGVYQYELAQFTTSSSGIANFVDKRTFVDFGSIYNQVNSETQKLIREIEEELQKVLDESIYVTKIIKKEEITLTDPSVSQNTMKLTFLRAGNVVNVRAVATMIANDVFLISSNISDIMPEWAKSKEEFLPGSIVTLATDTYRGGNLEPTLVAKLLYYKDLNYYRLISTGSNSNSSAVTVDLNMTYIVYD